MLHIIDIIIQNKMEIARSTMTWVKRIYFQ